MPIYSYNVNNSNSSSGPTSGPSANLSQLDEQIRKQYGTDLFFDEDYLITNKGDYQLLHGIANLRQAIYHRLITKPGEYKFVPEYGVGITTYVKRKRTTNNLDRLKNAITDNLLRDSRIRDIPKITVEYIQDGVKIGIVLDIAGRALRFRPFEFTEDTLNG